MTEEIGPLDALNETDSGPEAPPPADQPTPPRPRPDLDAIIASGAVW